MSICTVLISMKGNFMEISGRRGLLCPLFDDYQSNREHKFSGIYLKTFMKSGPTGRETIKNLVVEENFL
jgi:hypothetical protein